MTTTNNSNNAEFEATEEAPKEIIPAQGESKTVDIPEDEIDLSIEDPVLDGIPEPVRQFLAGAPEPVRRSMGAFFSSMSLVGNQRDSAVLTLLRKWKDSHITAYLEMLREDMKLSHSDAHRERLFKIICIAFGTGILVFLVLVLGNSNPDLLENLVFAVLGFLGGLGGGAYLRRKD
jgi:hypothetical protein